MPPEWELVAVSRLRAREQERIRFYDDRQEAIEEAEKRRKEEPLRYFVIFHHLSSFCRIVNWHSL